MCIYILNGKKLFPLNIYWKNCTLFVENANVIWESWLYIWKLFVSLKSKEPQERLWDMILMMVDGHLISLSNPLLVVTDGTVVMTMKQHKETDAQMLCQRPWCAISVMLDSKFVVCLIKFRRLFYVKRMEEFGYYVIAKTKRESELWRKRTRPLGHENVVGHEKRWDNIDRGIKRLKNSCMQLCQHIHHWLISLP